MKYLRIILILTVMLGGAIGAAAQQPSDRPDRDKVFSEMRSYKHRFLAKELDLTKEQEQTFFDVYDAMDSELMQINRETRDLERSVAENSQASDTEVAAAAASVYSQKEREAKVEAAYYERIKEVLTPRQLLKLRTAEKKFTQSLVRHHRRLKNQQQQ